VGRHDHQRPPPAAVAGPSASVCPLRPSKPAAFVVDPGHRSPPTQRQGPTLLRAVPASRASSRPAATRPHRLSAGLLGWAERTAERRRQVRSGQPGRARASRATSTCSCAVRVAAHDLAGPCGGIAAPYDVMGGVRTPARRPGSKERSCKTASEVGWAGHIRVGVGQGDSPRTRGHVWLISLRRRFGSDISWR
jgi:hypothetical protein